MTRSLWARQANRPPNHCKEVSCLGGAGGSPALAAVGGRVVAQAFLPVLLNLRFFARRDDSSPAWGRRSVFVVCLPTGRNPRKRRSDHSCLRRSRVVLQ